MHAEGAAGDVAQARQQVETHQLALARATRQAEDPDRLRQLGERLQQAEQALTFYRGRAEASELGRSLVQRQDADELDRQRAANALGPLARQGGYATLGEFQTRATPAGYALLVDADGRAAGVLD